jgi:SAM-dependent methyltransferase
MDNFDFPSLNQQFDFALAHSLFTHLPLNQIIRCIMQARTVLVPGGRLYATFFENPEGKFNLAPIEHPCTDGPPILSYFDKDPYHYDVETFRWICEGTGLQVDYIGEWGHLRDPKMLVFVQIE